MNQWAIQVLSEVHRYINIVKHIVVILIGLLWNNVVMAVFGNATENIMRTSVFSRRINHYIEYKPFDQIICCCS